MRLDTCRAPVMWPFLRVTCVAVWLTVVARMFTPLPPTTWRLRGSTGETSTTHGRHRLEFKAADLVLLMPSTVGWVLPEFASKHEVTGKQVQDVGEKSTLDHVGAHMDFPHKQEVGSNHGGDFDLQYALRWPERRRLESTRNSATGKHNDDSHLDFASRRRGHRSLESTLLAQRAVASVSQEKDLSILESRRDKIMIEDTGDFDSDLALRWPEPQESRRIEWPDAWRSIGELQERKHKEQRERDGNGSGVRTRRPFSSRRSGADPRFADSRRKLVTHEAKSGAAFQH